MSSPGFNATLELRLKPSLRAVQAVFALHALAIVLTFLAAPPKWAGLTLAILLLISWQRLRRPAFAGYGAKALTRLIWHAKDLDRSAAWSVELAGKELEDAELLGSSVVLTWLIVLNFKLRDGRHRTRLLLGDEADPELLRRLRARLMSGGEAMKEK